MNESPIQFEVSNPDHLDQDLKQALEELPQIAIVSKLEGLEGFRIDCAERQPRLSYIEEGRDHTLDFALSDSIALGRLRGIGKKDLLIRSVGADPSQGPLLDASAGFLKDALALARCGFEVVAMERNPILFYFLSRQLQDLQAHDFFKSFLHRLTYLKGSSGEKSLYAEKSFQAIYFDPMFEQGSKKGLSKIGMRAFHALTGHDEDAPRVAEALLLQSPRLVIKRPLKAQPLLDKKPSHTFKSNTVRFDMYLRN